MHIKQPCKERANNWENLPNIAILLQYLGREDLIELSKCCKSYRDTFESQVFKEMDLYIWRHNNKDIYSELRENYKIDKALEFMETGLGSKLKFIKEFNLDFKVDCNFAEKFVNLLPNVKTLYFIGINCEYSYPSGKDLEAIIKIMEHLEHAEFYDLGNTIRVYSSNMKIFPKSIKSIKISCDEIPVCNDNELLIYDTIDSSYINLHTLTILSNRMLHNLSSGMPNLQIVEIAPFDLDEFEFINFLKANTQLTKLYTRNFFYSGEMLKTILSSNFLEHWYEEGHFWIDAEVNSLPTNYSIKHLKICSSMPAPLDLQLINACKNLETLDIFYDCFNKLDLIKFERRINILKLSYGKLTLKAIKEIETLKLFNQVHLGIIPSIEKFIEEYNIDKLMNYKLIPLISGSCILKLVNTTN
ncbi:hypothetical protein CONCODRAFT_8440 [Conidiobolus coronatus NRRL 28638]|uniref:F-box domain-containing protein n=1 Tax=Conidiobolus coronatus (strain ATCC 28846 / CBS 209.66 / NRRL 28638) TaxID=796925 RepID=A0A137P2A7_CONC2|nr:hypothetical protein CONCODRAFT_8440 [Conidiobolus coronatus NRRL 28638]|eukprot:KXN69152.1 hypothetical protein CONCODRAFT_8440 [Conidiobolus coronatus NRRL 28638]